MLKQIYTVHDSKVQAYLLPQTYRTNAEAIRAFESACKDSNSQFHQYPSDFTLCHIAAFNEENGSVIPNEKPTILASASEFVQ